MKKKKKEEGIDRGSSFKGEGLGTGFFLVSSKKRAKREKREKKGEGRHFFSYGQRRAGGLLMAEI